MFAGFERKKTELSASVLPQSNPKMRLIINSPIKGTSQKEFTEKQSLRMGSNLILHSFILNW